MARADLLVRLVKAGMQGDNTTFRKVVSAIIAEERAKQHHVLAEQLEEKLMSGSVSRFSGSHASLLDPGISNLFTEIIPRRKLSSLVLPKNIVTVCQEVVSEQHRADLLRSYGIEPRNRLLFIGAPGNGKTSLAEAIAESLIVPLYIVRYENIIGTYLGETAQRLSKLFDFAATQQCVLFFDEFETLGKERGDSHETGEIKRVVSSLLMQIDKLPSYVVVIGATNHPELLDRAVWRRFQIRVSLPGPTRETLLAWFKAFEERIDTPLGIPLHILVDKLPVKNFSEAEEFGDTVFRHYILKKPDANMEEIVKKVLQSWSSHSAFIPQQQ